MKQRPPHRAARTAIILSLAAVLLSLCAGGLALQQPGGAPAGDHPGGPYISASMEALDSDETFPVDFDRLNVLALGLFLVSLGLLLGSGLVGRGAEQRLLELLRLPSVIPLLPVRSPLSALEVFRI